MNSAKSVHSAQDYLTWTILTCLLKRQNSRHNIQPTKLFPGHYEWRIFTFPLLSEVVLMPEPSCHREAAWCCILVEKIMENKVGRTSCESSSVISFLNNKITKKILLIDLKSKKEGACREEIYCLSDLYSCLCFFPLYTQGRILKIYSLSLKK